MVDSYLSTKFGINLLDGFWENVFYGRTDGRRTDDGRPRHGISSADSQAELKKAGKPIGDPVGDGVPQSWTTSSWNTINAYTLDIYRK